LSIKERARELLGGEVESVLGYRVTGGSHLPHLFTPADIDEMAEDYPADERYPVASIVRRLLAADPGIRIAVVVRGCDERALIELCKQGQIDRDRIRHIGLACDEELARKCGCSEPYPSEVMQGQKVDGAPGDPILEEIERLPSEERLDFWLSRFGSCIKCYGCRNVCPVCYCRECALDDAEMVERGTVPPTLPAFHLVRAVDMAGRCIDCGLCEEACPMAIPLRALYRKVGRVVEDNFGYRPGRSLDDKSPLAVLGTEKDVE
jgi:formate dehydrogenase subunit beta